MFAKNLNNLAAKLFLGSLITSSINACNKDNIVVLPDSSFSATYSQKDIINDQIVVKFKTSMSKSSAVDFAQQFNSRAIKVSTRMNSAVLQVEPGTDITKAIQSLNNNPSVDFAEPHYKYSFSYTVSDPRSREQNGLAIANVHKAWDITFGDPKVIIAVIDSGADLNHPDLKNKLVPGYNVLTEGQTPPMDDNGHGTHVSGIAAASTNNKIGIAGTAPNCRIMPVKVINGQGKGEGKENGSFNVALGVLWAVDHGAKVINMSLGGPDGKTLNRAVDYALKKNVVVVAAMGNDGLDKGRNFGYFKSYPAALPGVISVGSIDFDRKRSEFSNWGDWISVVAPGNEILSTLPDNNYDYESGTSMSSPMVAGLAALILSRNPDYTPAEVKERIESTATDLGEAGFDQKYGHGQGHLKFNI